MKHTAELMVMINVASVEDARAFYVDKLGFGHMMGMLGKDGQLDFCTLSLNGARVMLMRPPESRKDHAATSEKRPVELYLEVTDVEAYYEQVRKQKVPATTPLTDQWWGDRTFTVLDPYGYQIWFYQHVAEPKLPAGAKVV